MLKKKEECDTYLSHVFRHHSSIKNPVQRQNIRQSFQPTLWLSSAVEVSLFLQLMKGTVLAESSLCFIFALGPPGYGNVYKHETGRCRTLPSFLTFFKNTLDIPGSYSHSMYL